MRKLLLLLMIVPMIGLGQNTLLVPSQYNTIQNAINASSNHDTVLVSPGTYYENINFNGQNIFLTSYYHTTLDTSFISSTIIDGSDSSCVLIGFTITNGKGGIEIDDCNPTLNNLIISNNTADGGEDGGGIWIDYNNPGPFIPTFTNLIIKNNHSTDDGGGIFCHGPNGFKLLNSILLGYQ